MRKIALILAGCLVLTGCAGTWEAEVRLEVTKIEEVDTGLAHIPPDVQVWLDPVGDLPKDAYDRQNYHGGMKRPPEIDGDVKVGDEVICLAKQRTIGALQTNSIQTELFQCRKA